MNQMNQLTIGNGNGNGVIVHSLRRGDLHGTTRKVNNLNLSGDVDILNVLAQLNESIGATGIKKMEFEVVYHNTTTLRESSIHTSIIPDKWKNKQLKTLFDMSSPTTSVTWRIRRINIEV